MYPRVTCSAHTCRRTHGVLPSAPGRLGWLTWNNGGLHSSPFLLTLEKLLLAKNSPCVTLALDFSLKYNIIIIMQLTQRNQPLTGSCRSMMCLRGQDHNTSPGRCNLNLLYSYLNYTNCPKSQAVFMTIINSDCCDIQLLFLSVAFLLAVEKGFWGICSRGMHPVIAEWALRHFGSELSVTRQALSLKRLALPSQTSPWDHHTVSCVHDPALGSCTYHTAQAVLHLSLYLLSSVCNGWP